MIKLIISCLNVGFKKLIVWLQLYPKLIASDYITTGRPLGRTKAVHSCVTPQGAWSRGSEAWLADPSGLTYFNRNGRVRGLGKSSWYDSAGAAATQLSWHWSNARVVVKCLIQSGFIERWHDDVIKRKHFPRYRAFVVKSPHRGQWRGALMFSLI